MFLVKLQDSFGKFKQFLRKIYIVISSKIATQSLRSIEKGLRWKIVSIIAKSENSVLNFFSEVYA